MRPRRIKIATSEMGLGEHDDGVALQESPSGTASRFGRMPMALRHPLTMLGAVVIAVYALLAVILNVLVDTDGVREWLAPRASAVLNRPVTLGATRVALLPRPSIHVSDVRVDNLVDFDGPALVFAERVRLDVAWVPLLIGRVDVHRVALDGPRIYLAVQENGTSNFGDLVPGGGDPTQTPSAPVRLGVRRIDVSDASISYFDARADRSLTVSGLRGRMSLRPDGPAGWRAELTADSDSLHVRAVALTEEIFRLDGPEAALTAYGDGTGHAIDIIDGSLELGGETLALRGRLAGLRSPSPSYDLQLTNSEMDAAVFANAFPTRARATLLPHLAGSLGVTLQVTGARSPGDRALVRGSVSLDGLSLRFGDDVLVDGLRGVVGVTPDTLVLDSLTGTFADGPFELSGTVARTDWNVALVARARPDLDALDRLGRIPTGTTLSGDAALDLSLVGSLRELDSLDIAGVVGLTGVQAKHPRLGLPLYVPAGELALSGREVRWSELDVLIGQDAVVTSGRLSYSGGAPVEVASTPEMDLSIRGGHLDLGAVFPAHEGAPDVTYAQVAFAHLGGRRLEARAQSAVSGDFSLSRPASLPVHGTIALELDTLEFRRYHIEALTAEVNLWDSAAVVNAPSFRIWGGEAAGSLRLAVGNLRYEPFSLSLEAIDVDAEEFLAATTPAAEAVSGSLTLSLTVEGLLDAALLPVGRDLTGRARLAISDGHVHDTGPNLVVADFLGSEAWTDVAFDSWVTELEIVDRRLEIQESMLTGEGGQVALEGRIHLDGSLDLSLGLSIPPQQLKGVSLRRTGIGQSVLDHLSAAGSPLDLGLRMSGVLRAPVLEPDASNAVALAR